MKKNVFVIFVILCAVFVAYHFWSAQKAEVAVSDTAKTNEYINTKYGYSFDYPNGFTVRNIPSDYPSNNIQAEDAIEVYSFEHNLDGFSIYKAPDVYTGGVDLRKTALGTYAEIVRKLQIDDTSPYRDKKFVGALEKVTLPNTIAYRFELQDGFIYPGGWKEMSIPNNALSYIYILENGKGEKFVAADLKTSEIADSILKSVRFASSTSSN